MTANRFPTTRTGTPQPWLVPRDAFAAERYEGSDADERRLFYVAPPGPATGSRCRATIG
ncbi:MAG: hypothetical protein ACYC1D_00835 [Acidimicrobiales bacterium]